MNSVRDSAQQLARFNVLEGVMFEKGTNSRYKRPPVSRAAILSPATGTHVSGRPRQKMKGAVEKFPAPGQHLGNPNVSYLPKAAGQQTVSLTIYMSRAGRTALHLFTDTRIHISVLQARTACI